MSETSSRPPAWSRLHDLALVYLALIHGASPTPDAGTLSSTAGRNEAVGRRLAHQHPEVSQERVNRVVRGAMLAFIGTAGRQMLNIAVASLRQSLPRDRRLAVLDDLAGLASGGGDLMPSEMSFLQHLAGQWDLEQELVQRS